jgi:hypothetical protein
MSRLTADRRVLRDRLDDAVYLVRATGLKASGIEAVLSGSSAGGGVVSAVLAYARPPGSQRRVHRDLRQRLVSVHWALAHFPTEDLSPHLEGRDKVSRCQTKSSDLLPPPLLIGTSLLGRRRRFFGIEWLKIWTSPKARRYGRAIRRTQAASTDPTVIVVFPRQFPKQVEDRPLKNHFSRFGLKSKDVHTQIGGQSIENEPR